MVALDINPDRLAFCRDRMGVEATALAADDALERVRAFTDGDLPTAVFDATGSAPSMNSAFQYVASGGRLVFVGLFLGDVTFYDPDFHRKEITLLATRNSTGADFVRIIGLLESGEVDTAPWITHRARAADMPASFPSWLEPSSGLLKAVVEF